MSAYVVAKEHIDLLVRAALEVDRYAGSLGPLRWWQTDEHGAYTGWRTVKPEADGRDETVLDPSQLGQMLVTENVRSVTGRYPDTNPDEGDLPGPIDAYYMGPYVYADPGLVLAPGPLFKALDAYDYQSCEHDEWEASEAAAFCRVLRVNACTQVDGYDASPWGWDESRLAAAAEEDAA